jgi:hypothetical protein
MDRLGVNDPAMTALLDADTSFFYAAFYQLDPAVRPAFTARVTATIGAHPDPSPSDVDRAIHAALAGLVTASPDELEGTLTAP